MSVYAKRFIKENIMAEYKNGVNAFGNMSVSKEDRSAEVETGRAVFVDEDKYTNDPDYKLKVDKCLAEGFHRVGESGGGSSDFSTATVTFDNQAGAQFMLPFIIRLPFGESSAATLEAPSGVLQAILYKGNAMGLILGGTVTVTGSATYSAPVLTVTGDCTITISE